MTILIPASPDCLSQILKLEQKVYGTHPDFTPDPVLWQSWMGCGRIFQAISGADLLGAAAVIPPRQASVNAGPHIIETIFVHPDYRGQGVGSDMLKGILHIFDQARLPLCLDVERNNLPAVKLYSHSGFSDATACQGPAYSPEYMHMRRDGPSL